MSAILISAAVASFGALQHGPAPRLLQQALPSIGKAALPPAVAVRAGAALAPMALAASARADFWEVHVQHTFRRGARASVETDHLATLLVSVACCRSSTGRRLSSTHSR